MHRLISALDWLTKPVDNTLPGSNRRREHLLAWLLLSIFLLNIASLVLVLLVNPQNSHSRNEYVALILGLVVLVTLAYGLNFAGHYYISAGLTVACAVFGPWGSLMLDPTIIHGNFVPLAYVTLSVLLSSILLPPAITIALAAFQLVALMLVPLFSSAKTSIDWPSFLAFVFFTSVLSILANIVSQRDLNKIDHQTIQLILNEEHLRELSIRDPLTTLYNRRYLEETLEREIQRAARKQLPLGIIMVDIDHFKRINDTLGHAAGDAVLQELGKSFREQVRLSDIACRYGGEEFVFILPEASCDVAQARAEQLRVKVKHIHLERKNQTLETITISLGVAVFPNHGSTGAEILKSADMALYRAKYEGRDRVVVADE